MENRTPPTIPQQKQRRRIIPATTEAKQIPYIPLPFTQRIYRTQTNIVPLTLPRNNNNNDRNFYNVTQEDLSPIKPIKLFN